MKDEPTIPEPLNLVQKLASIRRELTSIKKQGHNAFQNYDYLRAEDIAGEMGDRLAAMNVILGRRNLRFEQNTIIVAKGEGDSRTERADVHVIVTLDYVFINGDPPPEGFHPEGESFESIEIASIGEGRDSGDKAVAKALTNALKYALTQPLMMRIGDDPEADSAHDQDKNVKKVDNARVIADTGEAATKEQMDKLYFTAFAKMGEAKGKAYVDGRAGAACTRKNWAAIMNDLLQMKGASRGEEDQRPPVEDNDIGF